jgi:hypothetical protein
MRHWKLDSTRALFLVCTVLFGEGVSASEIISQVLYDDGTYLNRAMTVRQETRTFLITRTPHGMSVVGDARFNIPKQKIRYLIMDDRAVPYARGAAQTPVHLVRRTAHPRAGLLPFAIASAGFALWQLKRHGDAATVSDLARQVGRSDLARKAATDADRHSLYAVFSLSGAVIAAIAGLEGRTELELGDGAVIRLNRDDTYRFRVARRLVGLTLAPPGLFGPGLSFTLR